MTFKQIWSMLRGRRTDFRFANMSMTYDPANASHHWYGKSLEYKQMHEMACRREADLEAQLRRRTTERDYHMRMADKLSARINELKGSSLPNSREEALDQNNRDLLDRMIGFSHALEKVACRHVTDMPLWWQEEARAALEGRKPWDWKNTAQPSPSVAVNDQTGGAA